MLHGDFDYIYLDVEVLPAIHWTPEQCFDYCRAKVPKNYKDPRKIKAWIEEHGDKLFLKTGLNPLTGHIHAVGVAVNDEAPHCYQLGTSDDNLYAFKRHLDQRLRPNGLPYWVVFNGKRFDLPYLRAHALRHKLHALAMMLPHDRWGSRVADVMEMWGGTDARRYTSLTAICEFLGIPCVADDGSDIYKLYQAGEVDRIAAKNKHDIVAMRQVYHRLMGWDKEEGCSSS